MIVCGENYHNEITSKVAELIRLSGEDTKQEVLEKLAEHFGLVKEL